MDFQGKVIQFLGETTGTSKAGKPWKKKEWVVETLSQYPRKVKIQCFGDRSDAINLEPGKDYTLYVDLESREFNGRWYTDVSLFRADEIAGGQQGPFQQPSQQFQPGYQAPQQSYGAPYGTPASSFPGSQSFEAAPDDSDEDLPF